MSPHLENEALTGCVKQRRASRPSTRHSKAERVCADAEVVDGRAAGERVACSPCRAGEVRQAAQAAAVLLCLMVRPTGGRASCTVSSVTLAAGRRTQSDVVRLEQRARDLPAPRGADPHAQNAAGHVLDRQVQRRDVRPELRLGALLQHQAAVLQTPCATAASKCFARRLLAQEPKRTVLQALTIQRAQPGAAERIAARAGVGPEAGWLQQRGVGLADG